MHVLALPLLLLLLCAALDAFCESLDAAEILPYMPQLISELLQVLQMGRPGVQEMALSAVSSIASAAEQAFQPYTGMFAQKTTDFRHTLDMACCG
jgi:hypothetical protein